MPTGTFKSETLGTLPFSPVATDDERGLETLDFLIDKVPGVETLVRMSMDNAEKGKTVKGKNNQVSSISTMTVGIEGTEFLIPTIFDGKRVSKEEATQRAIVAMFNGTVFPSGPDHKELDKLSKLISNNLKAAQKRNKK